MTQDPANDAAPAVEEDDTPSVFDIFETDTAAEEEGKWFDIFGDKSKGEIKLRGFACLKSINVRRRLETKYRRLARGDGSYPDDVQKKMMDEQIAEAIIVDWRGPAWRTKEGPIAYSKESALSIIQKATHLRNRVAQIAGDLDRFRHAEQVDAVKN
jgi:hypothetical protein